MGASFSYFSSPSSPSSSSSSSSSSSPTPSEGFGEGDELLHVLAVDDSIVERKFVEKLLTKSAYKVTTAENGLRALEYLGLLGGETKESALETNDLKINLIITDYCMPAMTGYELLKKVKESSNFKEIPVVIMSSENVPTRIEKCLEEGAQEFMLKPLQQSDVKRLRCHMMEVSKTV